MLKLQIALIAILIGCVAFISCERMTMPLKQVTEDTKTADDMPMDMMKMMDSKMYMSWAHVMLPAPTMTVMEAAAAMNPGGTGAAHGMGSRTVYFNEAGSMANMAGTAYPAGTMIIKKVMDSTETFVMQVVTMMKTDDPMYAAHNGWIYGATQRASETEELMMPQSIPVASAQGCHDCHAKAMNDSVFVSLPMDKVPETPAMPDADAGNGTDADGTGDTDAGGANGAGDGTGANGAGDGAQ